MTKWIAAAVQMDSQDNLEQNLEAAAYYVKKRPSGEPSWWCSRNA